MADWLAAWIFDRSFDHSLALEWKFLVSDSVIEVQILSGLDGVARRENAEFPADRSGRLAPGSWLIQKSK
jgi:hypothetical protein